MLERTLQNPLLVKGLRQRSRVKHLLSWGIVTLTITAFVALMIYTTITEREMASAQDAAKAVLPGIIVIQAILLMMSGTGAVASGVAGEREEGLLDYVRMTPMSPTSKILGYLFGLPAREYVLFALTMPFLVIAAAVARFDPLTLLHFYAVFFTSVWLYHLTGMVAGMVSEKPRLASMMSMGLVVVLYFVLPNLSRLGITFFEFLTIRPTFYGLLQQEMPEHLRTAAEQSGIDSFRDVPFFTGVVHPTLYTMLVQGFMLAVMFSVVHRRWRDQAAHLFSKAGTLLVFSGVLVFVLGSVWAVLVSDEAYYQVFGAMQRVAFGQREPQTLEILLIVALMIVGGTFVLLVTCATPSRHTAVEGWRRARKLGRRRIGLNADGASSLPITLAMIGLTFGAGWLVLHLVGREGLYYLEGPTRVSVGIVALSIIGVALFVQGLRERFDVRVFGVVIFVLWMIPFFAMMIMYSAFDAFVPGSYAGLPCPPAMLVFGIGHMLESTVPLDGRSPDYLPEEIEQSGAAITAAGAIGYILAAGLVQSLRARHWRAARRGDEGVDA
ncbi:MAG: hypothetical protein ACIARR_07420 [Phycisphaerales bacterium JB059]